MVAAGKEVINDEDFFVIGKIFGRDDQLDHAAFGVRRREGEIDLIGHGDGFGLAGVHNRQAEVNAGGKGRGNA
jgi:hypothetical protein